MDTIIIMAALAAVRQYVKNPAHAATVKHYLLELRNAINGLFPGE